MVMRECKEGSIRNTQTKTETMKTKEIRKRKYVKLNHAIGGIKVES